MIFIMLFIWTVFLDFSWYTECSFILLSLKWFKQSILYYVFSVSRLILFISPYILTQKILICFLFLLKLIYMLYVLDSQTRNQFLFYSFAIIIIDVVLISAIFARDSMGESVQVMTLAAAPRTCNTRLHLPGLIDRLFFFSFFFSAHRVSSVTA